MGNFASHEHFNMCIHSWILTWRNTPPGVQGDTYEDVLCSPICNGEVEMSRGRGEMERED